MRIKSHHAALVAITITAIIISLTGCSAAALLARGSSPSKQAGAPFEECLDKAERVFARQDSTTSADKAAAACHANRAQEVSRDTTTANAAARAAIAEGRVYDPYAGQWYGAGLYGDTYYWENPVIGGRGIRVDPSWRPWGTHLRTQAQRCSEDIRFCPR